MGGSLLDEMESELWLLDITLKLAFSRCHM